MTLKPWSRLQANVDLYPVVAYVGFLVARVFKADPRFAILPIDLTVLLAAVTLVGVLHRRQRLTFRPEYAIVIGLFGSFLIAAFQMDSTAYAETKVLQLLGLNGLAVFAPLAIIRTDRERRAFLNVLLVFASVLAADVAWTSLTSSSNDWSRIGGFEGQSIWSGRLAAAGLTIVATRALAGQWSAVRATPLIGLFSLAIASSGSRGPALAAVAAIGVAIWYSVLKLRVPVQRVLIIPVLGAAAGALMAQLAPTSSVDRIASIVAGDELASGAIRLDLFRAATEGLMLSPFGIGWGRFHTLSEIGAVPSSEGVYPHNLVLEIGLEAGWIALALFIAAVIVGLTHLWRLHPPSTDIAAILSLFCMYLVAAQFSGDANANRFVFAFVGIALATTPPVGKGHRVRSVDSEAVREVR